MSLAVTFLLASCAGAPGARQTDAGWQPGDLRALELPNANSPDLDLIGAYARLTTTDLELRFDLLGSPDPFDYDVYLALDTSPGNNLNRPLSFIPASEWEILLHFPARGSPRAIGADGRPAAIRPRIIRDSRQDCFTVRVSQSDLPSNPRQVSFQAFLAYPGEVTITDTIGPLSVTDPPPTAQAPVALVFWDGLPSATPAQALRRWDGAHTGPYGQRHGLGVLLRAASTSGVPIAVLDLKEPGRLAALEALGGLDLVRDMQSGALLLLPDLASGDPVTSAESLAMNHRASRQFRLASDPYFFGPLTGDMPKNYQAGFARLEDNHHIYLWKGIRLIPLPETSENEIEQADSQGLTIETRLALLRTALSSDPMDLVILGGSLPISPWGDSLVAGPALEFLAGHPWIKILNSAGLLDFPTIQGEPACPDLLCLSNSPTVDAADQIRVALEEGPDNLFSQLAWRTYRSLTDPTDDERLAALRANYLGQTGNLLAAAHWYAKPREESACESDLDWDGEPECILASEDLFFVFEREDARLVLAAAWTRRGPLQWIAPRSQFVVGLGDPSEWSPDGGLFADPQEIPGAFSSPPGDRMIYQADLQPGQATFTHPTDGTRKIFRLEGRRLNVSIETNRPVVTQLPLALIDSGSYSPGWYARYKADEQTDPSTVLWELSDGATISVSSTASRLSLHSFAESLALMTDPEDPNIGYPLGHFISFPFAVIDIQSEGPLQLEITIQD